MACAEAWSAWEGRTSSLLPNPNLAAAFADPYFALAMARIECHYFMHQSFLRPNQLLDNAHQLNDIPGVIIHGRYDVVCPVDQAHALHQVWPSAHLQIVDDAGHSASEPGIVKALLAATDAFADRLTDPDS